MFKMKKFTLVLFGVILSLNATLCYSTSDITKGPNPGPSPIKASPSPPNHRNRFLTHFQRSSAEEKDQLQVKSGNNNVKILEGLSKTVTATPSPSTVTTNILKRNPSPHFSKTLKASSDSGSSKSEIGKATKNEGGTLSSQISKRLGNVRREDYSDEQQSEVISSGYNSYPSPPAPVFPTTPKPYNNYNNHQRPHSVHYYPVSPPSGGWSAVGPSSTPSPIVFPAQPYPQGPGPQPQPGPQPESTPDPLPAIVFPPEPIGPPSPGTGTQVIPVIGGGSGGSGGGSELGEEEEDLFPPAPPDDIFPPSPPEIENNNVGRSLPLKSNPPAQQQTPQNVVRTRITPIGTVPVRTAAREREPGSVVVGTTPTRVRSGSGGSGTGSRKIVRVRQRDKVRDSIESLTNSNENQQQLRSVGEEDPNIITDFVFSDIKCFKTRNREYFGATIHMKSGYHPPYVRDRPQDPLTSNECHMENVPGSDDVFHMTVTDLKGCGVETCGDFMCLTMVFPRVPTLALADDEVTTIKCLPQKSTMSDTRTISFAGDSLDLRRSSSTVEGGGHDFAAEVGVFRQNPGSANGLFVKRVNSGGVVQLGEPLQLRSIVRGGDGWKHSKLSDVKVWRMRDAPGGNLDNLDPNDASEVITLVDGEGCRNDEYQVIADRHPLKDPRNDLINHFNFKAFLFRGQRANEPLVLTAKVHACQDNADCVPKTCEFSSRTKRSPVELHNASSIIHDWDSRLAIRVIGLKDQSASLTEEDFPSDFSSQGRSLSSNSMSCTEKMAAAGLGGGLIVLLLCGIVIALYAYVIKGRRSRSSSSSSNKTNSNPATHPSFLENGPPPPPRNHHPQHQIHNNNNNSNNHTFASKSSSPNKPLPPPPPATKEENEKVSKSDITNVAKILQRLADKDQGTTDYACIDENSSTSISTSSSSSSGGGGNKGALQRKKNSDGVYIVYVDNNKNKAHRPKSAPPSLRGKNRKQLKDKLRKQCLAEIFPDSETQDQTEDATEDSSEDSSSLDSSGSDGNRGSKKCVGFVGRRTVRDVKSRSSHHSHHRDNLNQQHFASQKQKVVKGIRRRLSSLYKDGKQGLGLGGSTGNANLKAAVGGSFPTRWKAGTAATTTGNMQKLPPCDENYPASPQHSSDLDSAYYGSEFNDEILLHEMRELALEHRRSRKCYGGGLGSIAATQNFQDGNNNNMNNQNVGNNQNLCKVKMQLQKSQGKCSRPTDSPPLEMGQTKAAHFVTRNENSTQILIVPETHV